MTTDTRDQKGRNDNRILWAIVAIIIFAIAIYAAYAAYYRTDNYTEQSYNSNVTGTTNNQNGTTTNQ